MRITVCVRNFTRIIEVLKRELPDDEIGECDAADVVALSAETDIFIPTVAPIPAAAFAAPRVKMVQQFGVGLDSIDTAAATRAGVMVANVASVGTGNAESVAELAILHMLMLSRNIPKAARRFAERRVGSPLGDCLWGSTVTIVGYGGIGEEIARRLSGFGVRIIAVSRSGPDGRRQRDPSVTVDKHVAQTELAAALAEADYVVVAAPATADNIGLIDRTMLAKTKRGAFVINIARGPVIDYQALLDALRDGQVRGAGIDVFWHEPFDPNDPILAENVIATPHIGGATERSFDGIGRAVAANINRVRHGREPLCWANPEVGRGRMENLPPISS